MSKVIPCLMVLCAIGSSASALTVTCDSPCNVVVAGSPIRLMVRQAQGAVSYELVDYFGSKIAEGRAVAAIRLPGLQPGWYELKCRDDAQEASVYIGVVLDRGDAPLPADGRVGIDVAGAWLVKQDLHESLARTIRTAGIPWVRERLAWSGRQTESNGPIDWAQYQALADFYAAEGVHISQKWADSPAWSHPGRTGNVCPDDLRALYYFARAAARQFTRQIEAWEIGNEQDSVTWPDLSDRYSGMVKSAFLGLKDGNPRATVLVGSICRGVTSFTYGMYECGVTDYFDVFNWHIYSQPSVYPSALRSLTDQLGEYGAGRRPVWLTEAGTAVSATEGPGKRILNSANQRRQCQFMPRAAAMSIVAGNDKFFYFVLPSYTEGVTQFGAMLPDLTPYPSFVALSAAANIIGRSIYKGEYKAGGDGVVAHLFSTPTGSVLVVWSDTDSVITVPTDRPAVRIADIFGRESSLTNESGSVKVKVGPDAVYLLDPGKPIEKQLTGKPRPLGRLPKLKPSRVVLMGHCDLPIIKAADAYKLPDQEEFDHKVEVYNFSEKTGAVGTVEVSAPEGWLVKDAKRTVTVGPMGREVLAFRVKAGAQSASRASLTARGSFGGEKVAPSVSSFSFDLSLLTPAQRRPLDWADGAARWTRNVSPNGTVAISSSGPDSLRFDIKFEGAGDRWAYPFLRFDKPMDMSGYDGFAFDLDIPEESAGTLIRVMLAETSGAHYIATARAHTGKRRVVFLFSDLERLDHMGADPNGRFDPDAIAEVKFGCNARSDRLVLDVSGLELVKF